MNNLQIFNNDRFGEIRTVEDGGKVLFCGSDVANALGYSNARDAISKHCRCVAKRDIPHPQSPDKTIEMSFITEGDIYRLITHSKLPTAQEFEHWVFDEVLPTIRRNGAYMTDSTLEQALTSPDFLIQLATKLKEEKEKNTRLETTVAVQNQQILELKPKASYYDVVLNCKDLLSTTEIAKDYGKSAIWLNKWLHEHGIQYKQGQIWLLYQKYADRGYMKSKTHTVYDKNGDPTAKVHSYWTQQGRIFIYYQLKKEGILPLIEQDDS